MVQRINKILYTTDLSESAITVFEQAVILASQTGASIVLLHVIEDGSSGRINRTVHLVNREAYEQIRTQGLNMAKETLIGKRKTIPLIQHALEELCAQTTGKVCHHDHPVAIDGIEVHYGNAADIITQVADASGCDLIVMGYHRKGSILKALMGSSGKSVLAQSQKPVYLVPSP